MSYWLRSTLWACLAWAVFGLALAQERPKLVFTIPFGQELIDQARWEEAREYFGAWREAEPEAEFARLGWLRTLIAEQPEPVEVFEQLDRQPFASEIDTAYLRGMASYRWAQSSVDGGTIDANTSRLHQDAYRDLQRVLETDPERYGEAWLPLARSAWFSQALEHADHAGRMAMRRNRVDPEVYMVWGRIRFSRYAVVVAEDGDAEQREVFWDGARHCFELALEMYFGGPEYAAQSEANLQLGHLHAWKEQWSQAEQRYAQALAFDPGGVDVSILRQTLSNERLLTIFRQAHDLLVARTSAEDPQGATLLWWIGYLQFEQGAWEPSRQAFEQAYGLWPEYTDTWYYRFRIALELKQYEVAVRALETLREKASAEVLQLVTDEDLKRLGALKL